jgi:hypothetical protein
MKKVPIGHVFFAENRDRKIGENDKNRTVFVEEDGAVLPLQFTATDYNKALTKASDNTEDFSEYDAYDPSIKNIGSTIIIAFSCLLIGFAAAALLYSYNLIP